jgi:hypothetical protein
MPYNETKRKVYIKKETPYVSIAFETIVDVDVLHMTAIFDNFECLMELVPILYKVTPLYKATDSKMILRALWDYPWPLADRELVMHVTGVVDYKNKGVLTLSKNKKVGTNYFDYVAPEVDPTYKRIELVSLY